MGAKLPALAAFILGCAAPTAAQTVTVSVTPSTTITVTATPSSTVPSNAPQFTDPAAFTAAVLNSSNVWRGDHGAAAVAWNDSLAGFAAAYLASMGGPGNASSTVVDGTECVFAHSGGVYGENLALGCVEVTGCVDLWGREENKYNWSDPGFSELTGHFTQLVWKNTTTVGCGSRLCGTKGWYLVCEYWPRGNIGGQFEEQVGKPVNGTQGDATDTIKPPAGRLWQESK